MAWGALRPKGNVPSRHLFPPPFSSSGRSGKSSTLRAPQSKQAKVPTEPPWARPPDLRALGWNWALGKTAHFSGTEALPLVIPHTGIKLGALARTVGERAWGPGCPNQTRTHAPAARLREKASSAQPLLAAPVTEGTTPDQKGSSKSLC